MKSVSLFISKGSTSHYGGVSYLFDNKCFCKDVALCSLSLPKIFLCKCSKENVGANISWWIDIDTHVT